MEPTNHTILITGGATGIGFALAQRLLDAGNTVIICGRSQRPLDEAVERLPGLVACRCDVSNDADRRAMADWLTEHYPSLNVLVNNAGVQHPTNFATDTVDMRAVQAEVEINLIAPILLSAELLPLLRNQPESVIVNMTSGLAFCPLARVPVYCATKAALHSFTLSLRHQLADTSVRVVEMAPPIVDTSLGGVDRREQGDGPVVTPEQFAEESIRQLLDGADEIFVGFSKNLRERGEAMFPILNG